LEVENSKASAELKVFPTYSMAILFAICALMISNNKKAQLHPYHPPPSPHPHHQFLSPPLKTKLCTAFFFA
jgi:hypothetical protein